MEWKQIAGYEGLYEVSDTGLVRSVDRMVKGKANSRMLKKGKILKQKIGADGYFQVTLSSIDGSTKHLRVSRIVADAFCEHPLGKDVVHHKDENIRNNHYTNLQWVTIRENLYASDVFGKLAKQFSKPIECRTVDGEFVGEFKSVREASETLGLDARHISAVLTGRRGRRRNYVFSYKKGGGLGD